MSINDKSSNNLNPQPFIIFNKDLLAELRDPNQFIYFNPKPSDWDYVDNWIPMPDNIIFKSIDEAIILPVPKFL